jgi:DNA-binding response OmpR family regulator
MQSGFEVHLSKPIDPGELMAAAASLARRKRP